MRTFILVVFIALSQVGNITGQAREKCRAAVYAIKRPSNGRVQTCCAYSKIRFICNAGYKLTDGDKHLRCRNGRIYGRFPRCILGHEQKCGLAGFRILSGRIFGGSNSRAGEWPWMAAIYRNGQFVCGGAVITSSYVLTAAHCFYIGNIRSDDPSRYEIWLGRTKLHKRETKRKQFSVAEQIYINSNFSMATFSSDIAIIKLKTPVTFTKYVQPLCLPDKDKVKDQRRAYVSGWGKTGNRRGALPRASLAHTLQYIRIPIASDTVCRNAAPPGEPYLQDTMLCAGDGRGVKDACAGDSGGPLVVYEKVRDAKEKIFYKWTAVGIVSWGDGCAKQNTYGYYTRVFAFINWINSIVGYKD